MALNYRKLFIGLNETIKKTMRQLGRVSEKTLFVVDSHEHLLGSVTDGDIRRWLLKDGTLDHRVGRIMKRRPITVTGKDDIRRVRELLIAKKIECVPIVDEQNKIVGIHTIEEVLNKSEISNFYDSIKIPVVIIAGGRGKRLKPFTEILPKPLIPVGNKTIIERIMDEFHDYGVNKFHVIVNYKAELLKVYFKEKVMPYKMEYTEERRPLGTAGGLKLLKNKLSSAFFLSNCDVIVKANYADILKFHRSHKNAMTIVCSMKSYHIPYGVIYMHNNGELKHMREKPELDFLVSTGLYVLDPGVLEYIPERRFLDMNDFIKRLKDAGQKIGIYPIGENAWIDTGEWDKFYASLKEFRKFK